ncbi:MAG TPA: extracellular solute-binding protein, partial [Pseudodesulfovibrio sp.]|nr:extracellular solute-binding protein [Pseudodesulfovibrio sp.]
MKRGRLLRTVLVAVSLTATAMLGAMDTALAQDKPFAGITVRMATFGGKWRDLIMANVGKAFADKGGKLEVFAGQPGDNVAKLIMARGAAPPYDLLEAVDNFLPALEHGGFIEPMDLDKIPNKSYLAKNDYDKFKLKTWTTESAVLYNTEKFKQEGIPAPKTYDDLLNPKLRGHVSYPDIGGGGAIPCIVGAALTHGGDESNIDPGLEFIRKLHVKAFWKSSSELQTLFKSGDIWAACAGVHNIPRLHGAVPLWATHVEVKPGRVGITKEGWMVMVKGGKNREAAEWVINNYLGVAHQTAIAKGGLLPSNQQVLAAMAKDPKLGYMRLKPDEL